MTSILALLDGTIGFVMYIDASHQFLGCVMRRIFDSPASRNSYTYFTFENLEALCMYMMCLPIIKAKYCLHRRNWLWGKDGSWIFERLWYNYPISFGQGNVIVDALSLKPTSWFLLMTREWWILEQLVDLSANIELMANGRSIKN